MPIAMAIQVQCGCGKSFQAVDALAGKKVRCPACGTMTPVPAGGSPAAAKGTKLGPSVAAARKTVRTVPAISLSPKAIAICCVLVGLPLLIVLVKIGPVRAMDQWRELEPLIDSYTYDIVTKVCRDQYKGVVFDQFVQPPKVTSLIIDGPIMMVTVPREVSIQGRSTEGRFKGTYFTRDRRFEIEIGIAGDSQTFHVKSHVDDKGNPVIDEQK